MRESTQSHVTFTVYNGEAISGAMLMEAIEVATQKHGFRGTFYIRWEPHYLDNRKCKRPRILRRLNSGGTGDPRQSYGFFLTQSHKLCRPLVIDPQETYDHLYLVVDSWGENFKQQMHRDDFEKFLDRCREQGEKLSLAIQDALKECTTS